MRLGDIVTVSGKVTIGPVATGVLTRLGLSLPAGSDFADEGDCGGVAVMSAILGDVAGIKADATNNRAEIAFVASQPSEQALTLLFQYVVKNL